jgi:YVTN family beta-propeller protein
MRTSKCAIVTLVLVALVVLGGFGVSESSAANFGACTGPVHLVDIVKLQPWFTPVQLIINVGDCVKWTHNDDATTHTVTSLSAAPFTPALNAAGVPTFGPVFDSGKLLPGDTFSNNFATAGVNPYVCIIHPWMAGDISVGTGVGPVPDILQGTDTQDMATPDTQGVIGIGEWCTTATYEYPGFFGVPNFPYPGVVHCGSAHLWLDSNETIKGASGALETHQASGVTAANGFTNVECVGERKIGGRFEGATTTHNLWNNNHFTKKGDPIGPNGTATGNPPGSVISQPNRHCFTFSTNLHGQTFQWILRSGGQGIIGSTDTLFAGDVTHVMTNPGGTVGWVTMEAGRGSKAGGVLAPMAGCTSDADRSVSCIKGHLGIFDPNAMVSSIPPMITQTVDLGPNFPHGNWVCGNGIYDTVPAPLSNTIGVVKIPSTPTATDGMVVAFNTSAATYPVATGTLPNCTKAYTSNAVSNIISVTDAMTAAPITTVSLGPCSTCTLMGASVPTIHVPIQIVPAPDNSKVFVQGSKSSLLAVIDTATNMVIAQMDCGNGCHGSYIGPKLGGGFYVVASAAYQDKMSIYDMTTVTKVGDVRTNMNSLLGLQGTTPLGNPNITTTASGVGWNSGVIAWPQMPPWK